MGERRIIVKDALAVMLRALKTSVLQDIAEKSERRSTADVSRAVYYIILIPRLYSIAALRAQRSAIASCLAVVTYQTRHRDITVT